ncbi:MAG: glutathione S-transferase family protein [Granulosicoccus sp.]
MKLHWSPRSPFVRKVMIVLHETGQITEVDCVRSVVAISQPPNSELMLDNPLNKIPTLITDDGITLFDSRVISEYLDAKTNNGLFPSAPVARFQQLRWQALADGLTDNLLLWRTELSRDTGPWEAVTSGWLIKTRATLTLLEKEASELDASTFGIGHIALVCALGQLDFRWPDSVWRDHFPSLAKLEKYLSQRPSVIASPKPIDDDVASAQVTESQLTFGC